MFRGNPAHSGVYSTPTSISSPKWKFKTGAKVFSSPAISDGVVYIGSSDTNLYALSAGDGALRWKRTTRGAVNSSPAVVDGTVFFTSRDGLFYAVDAATGKDKWTFKTEGERRFTAPAFTAPTRARRRCPTRTTCSSPPRSSAEAWCTSEAATAMSTH